MIDIHSHILPFVDDGSESMKTSMKMLRNAIDQGITDIILTPHFDITSRQNREYDIYESFNLLIKDCEKENLKINLYLGHEVTFYPGVSKEILRGNALSINKTKYILLELTHHVFLNEIEEALYEISTIGYTTIVAHLERYGVYNPKAIKKIKDSGALIQINATAFFIENATIRRAIMKLVKLNLVDFIASDQHYNRENRMEDAYKIIKKNFGKEKADLLFYKNAKTLLLSK